MTMKGNKNRQRGNTFMNYIARELRDIWFMARRNFQERGAIKDGADVEETPYWLECKYGKRPNLLAAIRQSVAETDGRPILIAYRQEGNAAYIIQPFRHWKKLANKAVLYDRVRAVLQEEEIIDVGMLEEPWVGRLDYEKALKESEEGCDEPSGP